MDMNIRMLQNVISLARRQSNLNRLLFASTSEVYAGTLEKYGLEIPTVEGANIVLSDLSSPRTTYMLSKIVGEVMCQHSGVPFTIFRPHNIYGPRMGMAHVIPELLMKVWDIQSPQPSSSHPSSLLSYFLEFYPIRCIPKATLALLWIFEQMQIV